MDLSNKQLLISDLKLRREPRNMDLENLPKKVIGNFSHGVDDVTEFVE